MVLLGIVMTNTAHAQGVGSTGNAQTTTAIQDDPNSVSDTELASRLSDDLRKKNPSLGDNSIYWFTMSNGYYGTYTIGDDNYMTFYSTKGVYVRSYRRGNWDEGNVPLELKSAFNKSKYKDQSVTGFWIISDPGVKGYYLEVQDKQGNVSKIYANENGKFSTKAPIGGVVKMRQGK